MKRVLTLSEDPESSGNKLLAVYTMANADGQILQSMSEAKSDYLANISWMTDEK